MCMAIPMQVISVDELGGARCTGRNGEAHIDTLLTGPLQPGQWVLTFLGAAREVVSADEAKKVEDALDALDSVLHGRPVDLDAAFADLVHREPQLPPHLRAAAEAAAAAPDAPSEDERKTP